MQKYRRCVLRLYVHSSCCNFQKTARDTSLAALVLYTPQHEHAVNVVHAGELGMPHGVSHVRHACDCQRLLGQAVTIICCSARSPMASRGSGMASHWLSYHISLNNNGNCKSASCDQSFCSNLDVGSAEMLACSQMYSPSHTVR